MQEGKLIIVDDDEAVLKTLRLLLSQEFRTVIAVSSPSLLPALLREQDVDLILLDMNFTLGKQNGNEGLFWLNRVLTYESPPAVVIMTAYGDIELAVSSLKQGAIDFIVKPFDNVRLKECVLSAYKKSVQRKGMATASMNDATLSVDADTINRKEAAALFIRYFLDKFAAMYGKPYPVLSVDAHAKLSEILWHGSLPLLEKAIERAVLLHNRSDYTAACFQEEALPDRTSTPISLEEMEKQFITAVLKEKDGNLTLVARQLKISRQTLYNKLKKFDL